MDWIEFVIRAIEAVAWPIVVAGSIWFLRKPLSGLLSSNSIKRFEIGPGGLKIEMWDRTIEAANRELEEDRRRHVAPPSDPVLGSGAVAAPILNDFLSEMLELARISPRAAVMESFSQLEQLLRDRVGVREERQPPGFVSLRRLGRLAEEKKLMSNSERAVLEDLTSLRNAVAHSPVSELDEQRAVEFVRLVHQMIIAVLLAGGETYPGD